MSDHSLPDDLARWPKDPFQLLGVSHNVSARDLRRAYTRLILQFKPEQYPEHFRRIREAYESALPFIGWMDGEDPSADSVVESAQPVPAPSEPPNTAKDSQPSNDAVPSLARMPCLDNELRDLWDQAVAGQEVAAYRRLLELSLPNPNDPEILLRLYWLLTLKPDVDPSRHPCDWLVQGMQARGLSRPFRELYRQELMQNPPEAYSGRYMRLLDGPWNPGQLSELAEWRWQALAEMGRWDLLAGDLPRLRPRIIMDDEETWVRLLFTALDWLAWAGTDLAAEVFDSCRLEIYQYEHLAGRMPYQFDRLDFLLGFAAGWRKLQNQSPVPERFTEIMELSWTRSAYELKPRILVLLEDMCQEPQTWLGHLDRVQRHAPGAVAHFGTILHQLEDDSGDSSKGHSDEAIARLGQDFLDGQGMTDYPELRSKLLNFCLTEAIAPEKLADAVGDRPAYWPPRGISFSQEVNEDWPLRYLYLAHHLFWSL
jgi:hypothetical protein